MKIGKVNLGHFRVQPGLNGTIVEIRGNRYYFGEEAAQEFNKWLDMVERGLLADNESLGKIKMHNASNFLGPPEYFSPIQIKKALEKNKKF